MVCRRRLTWRGFRAADNSGSSKRHIDEVALEEVANAAAYLLVNSGETPVPVLAKDLCRLFGMSRITSESQSCAEKGIELPAMRGRRGC